jgi:transcriptional regulator with PAS, ATPase and Fis domain
MHKVKVAIVGADRDVYESFKSLREVEVVGIVDINQMAPGFLTAREDIILVTDDIDEILKFPELDLIIETTGNQEIQKRLNQKKKARVSIMDIQGANLMAKALKEKEELLEFKKIQGELSAILNSMQEAIEVADVNGTIKYVNPAFTRITGIPEADRIGKNVFKLSPDGALSTAIKTGKMVFGQRTKVGGCKADVVSISNPIVVDGKMEGGVVVFQHFTDMMNLMEELKKSTTIIENLTNKLGQVTTSKYTFSDIIGTSGEMKRCINLAEKSAQSNSTVLLLGESGTGKELFAHAIHAASIRRENPFIKVNCAAIPETLLESEFFGYAKGAFTGAVKSKIGKFELAHGGTIFLDEIGDMNLLLQAKLLRVLQEMEFERVGGNQTIKVDVRVIAATNRNLRKLIREGKFREDLYYRLNVVEITVPPLRVHKEDLPILVNNLIIKLNRKLGKRVRGFSKDAGEILFNYDWPGNIRELENVIERVIVTADDELLTKKNLIQHVNQFRISPERSIDLMPIDQMEEMLIRKAVSKYGNSVEGKRRAAQALNISLATLYNKLKKVKPVNNYKN